MDEIRRRFLGEVAARLFTAAESDAKTEMIEELTDNLYHRYLDLTAAGVEPEEAYRRALDNLGDVSELISYLNGDPQDEGYTAETAGSDPFWDLIRGAEKVAKEAFTTAKSAWNGVRDRIREDGRFQWQSQGGHFDINVDFTDKGVKFTSETEGRPIDGPIPAQNLRGIDVQNVNGDVTVSFSEVSDGDVIVGGDTEKLEVSFAADGVLIVRPQRTAASSLLFRRGVMAADIDIRLPFRRWDVLQISSVNGDVVLLGSGAEAGQVYIRTVSGDVDGNLSRCDQLTVDSVSGDIDWRGDAADLQAQTVSGDMEVSGRIGKVKATSVSGDMEFVGPVDEFRAISTSGDIRLETATLPQSMTLSAKSGDCDVRLPDAGPFAIELKTVSGNMDWQFPLVWAGGVGAYGEGARTTYTVTSVSGDVRLEKY